MSEYRIFETDEFQNRLAELPPEEAEYARNRLTERVYPQLRRAGESVGAEHRGPAARGGGGDGRFRLFYRIDHEDRVVYLLTFKRREPEESDELDEELFEALPDAAASELEPEPDSSEPLVGEVVPPEGSAHVPPYQPPEDFSPFAR